MPTTHEFGSHLFQLRSHPFPHRVPGQQELPPPRLSADMREPEQVERFGLPQATNPTPLRRVTTELDEASLPDVQLESEPIYEAQLRSTLAGRVVAMDETHRSRASECFRVRQEQSEPLLREMRTWLTYSLGAAPPQNVTGKANQIEPFAYLRFLFERIPAAQRLEDFEPLLPDRLDPTLLHSE